MPRPPWPVDVDGPTNHQPNHACHPFNTGTPPRPRPLGHASPAWCPVDISPLHLLVARAPAAQLRAHAS
jgi:hypothetical protein